MRQTRTASPPTFPVHDIVHRTDAVTGSPVLVEEIDDDGAPRSPHRHAFTQLIVIEAGSGVHSIDFTPIPIRAGEIHVLAPGQVHAWHAEPGLQGTAVMFSEDLLDPVCSPTAPLRELLLLGAAPITPTRASLHRQLRLISILAESRAPDPVRHLLAALLCECVETLRGQHAVPVHSSLTRSFLRLVLHAADARLTVSGCAAKLGVTTGHLTEHVVADTGQTPGQLLRAAVAREAQRLLSGTTMSSAQISKRLRFSEASYFSRFFRREVGCTPTTFRDLGIHRATTSQGSQGSQGDHHAG